MATVRCDKGKIVIQNGNLEIVQPFNKLYLGIPIASLIGFIISPSTGISVKVSIHTTTSVHELAMVTGFQDLHKQLPHVPVEDTKIVPWYRSQLARSHVGIYTNQKAMQDELAQAVANGWQVQGQSAQSGQSSAAAVLGGAIVAGPVGAMMAGAHKSKGTTTLTFARTPEWLAAHPLPK